MLGNHTKPRHERKVKKGQSLHFEPIIGTPPTFHIHWKLKHTNSSSFVVYDSSDDKFVVKQQNILSIRLKLHISKSRNTVNEACLHYSDGWGKCKAALLKKNTYETLHIKDKTFLIPGSYISVDISHPRYISRGHKLNSLVILQSFYSGVEEDDEI
ncbi:unnamed protein product [Mytilus coruscus]|uniref:Uncharacterized protein n=1 Tax=Mytilus coruscus TaxID=42192 RepID=A0A6J8E9J9_MYTCO|nr:unnamed protein product [Mytilus coruscus]